ncbi:hypothetical protein L6452_33715 [Arctium lappa]|uniref:Uncharacterized protein n=1 Tax=Arctium lappa TaxID=4217 RepID=A0ACB8YHC0_ARCLA|nr:hypothetical protein L6452_33715 [Arctium lappa]
MVVVVAMADGCGCGGGDCYGGEIDVLEEIGPEHDHGPQQWNLYQTNRLLDYYDLLLIVEIVQFVSHLIMHPKAGA